MKITEKNTVNTILSKSTAPNCKVLALITTSAVQTFDVNSRFDRIALCALVKREKESFQVRANYTGT